MLRLSGLISPDSTLTSYTFSQIGEHGYSGTLYRLSNLVFSTPSLLLPPSLVLKICFAPHHLSKNDSEAKLLYSLGGGLFSRSPTIPRLYLSVSKKSFELSQKKDELLYMILMDEMPQGMVTKEPEDGHSIKSLLAIVDDLANF
jgi:hypothetical protein